MKDNNQICLTIGQIPLSPSTKELDAYCIVVSSILQCFIQSANKGTFGPWGCSSGQCACLLLRRSEFEFRQSLSFLVQFE